MRTSTIAFLAAIAASNAKLSSVSTHRNLIRKKIKDRRSDRKDPFEYFKDKPDLFDIEAADVGHMHNVAFDILTDKYSSQLPESDFELMMDVGETLSTFCPEKDSLCDAFVYRTTLEEFYDANNRDSEVDYTNGFHEDIKATLEATDSAIKSLNENNVDDVIDELSVIMDDLEKMKKVRPEEQALAIAGVSVAMGSMSLWHDAYSNENNPLNAVLTEKARGARRLDEEEEIIVVEVTGRYWDGIIELIIGATRADYFGAVVGGKKVLAMVPANPNLLWPWNWPFALLSVALFHSIPASAQFTFGTNSTAVIPN